jgi:hypothetical protein
MWITISEYSVSASYIDQIRNAVITAKGYKPKDMADWLSQNNVLFVFVDCSSIP